MDDLLADFIAETREMLEAIGGELVAWEAEPGDSARLDAIFRFVHTVKGNCGFFDFPRLAQLSHAAEDALAECRGGRRDPDRALVSAVLAIVDRIGDMTDAIEAGVEFPAGGNDALIAALAADADDDRIDPAATAAPDAATRAAPGKAALQRTIRLPVSLLDEVMKGVSDMVLARNDLSKRLRAAGEQPTIDGPFERLSTILADVRNGIARMRMQRLEHLFASLPRLVRDLSNELGKQVLVEFEGADVELDREMIEMIRDPLTHIIRNAIDHGLESPAERRAAGKSDAGLLRFSARQSGNQILLTVTDDGRGIATDRLEAKAIEAKLYSAAEMARLSERDKLRLIFEPGLSTAETVSAVSGRGVGMDVVRANLEKVGGSIDVSSDPGEGSSIYLQLPLTISMISALTVRAAGQRYAIPRNYVEDIVFGNSSHVEFARAGAQHLVTFRGKRVPCLALSEILGLERNEDVDWEAKTLVLVRLLTDEMFAIAVDKALDHEDVVVKPAAPAVFETRLYAGTTLLDDGQPLMLLDVPSIAAIRGLVTKQRSKASGADKRPVAAAKPGVPIMLFRDLGGVRRAVRLDLVRRIETIDRSASDCEGARAHAVIDGTILTLTGHDGHELADGRHRLLRLSDGERELVHIVGEVLDSAEFHDQMVPTPDDPAIEGLVLVDGESVAVIDGHTLFARLDAASPAARDMTCRIPADSEWARTILEPLVRAAGYRLVTGEQEADVAIVLAEADRQDTGGARNHIRLTADREAGGDDAIYRYDRDALLAALGNIRRKGAA